jgi:hypothetical protein
MPKRRACGVQEQCAVGFAAVVLAPRHLACVLVQVNADPMMLAELSRRSREKKNSA